MSTFQVRVEDYYGGTISDTTALTDQLTSAAKMIVNMIPEHRLERYVSELTDTGSGSAITSYRFVRAHKNGRGAIPVSAGEKYRLNDGNSLYTADARSPYWYLEAGKVYVVPNGGTVCAVAYPTVLYSDGSVTSFPTEMEQAIIFYVAVQQLLGKNATLLATLDALTIDTVSAPTAPDAETFAYVDAVIGTFTATTIGDLGTAPTYTKPTVSLTAAPTALDLSLLITIPTAPTDFSLTASAPSAPADASYAYVDAVIGTYTATTIGSLGTAPAYTKPTTTFDITNATTYIATEEDFEKASIEINKQATLLEQFGKDLYNELNEFNKELEIYKSTVQNAFNQAQLDQERLLTVGRDTTNLNIQNEIQTLQGAIALYQAKLGKYQEEINSYQAQVNAQVQTYQQLLQKYATQLDGVRATLDRYIQEYRANLERWATLRQTELQNFASDIQNELNEFNKELAVYQSTVQKALDQAKLDQERLMIVGRETTNLNIQNEAQTLQGVIALAQTKLQKYQGQIGAYGTQVNYAVQKLQSYIQKYLGEVQANTQIIEQLKAEFKQVVSVL